MEQKIKTTGTQPLDFEQRKSQLIQCPHCHNIVSAAHIDLEKLIAKCDQCNRVFPFDHQVEPVMAFPTLPPEMLIPDGLEVLKLQSELDIRINWFRAASKGGFAFLLMFTTIWNLILLPFVITAFATGQFQILLFTSLHILVGSGLIYYLASVFINTTTVNVTNRYLEIETSPLPNPFRKDKKIPGKDISQLYVTKYVASRTNGRPNYAYALYAKLKSGKTLNLVKGMNRETQKYLEYEIERFLKIKDTTINGEEQ